jgi:hypothetical protein
MTTTNKSTPAISNNGSKKQQQSQPQFQSNVLSPQNPPKSDKLKIYGGFDKNEGRKNDDDDDDNDNNSDHHVDGHDKYEDYDDFPVNSLSSAHHPNNNINGKQRLKQQGNGGGIYSAKHTRMRENRHHAS